jgi:2,3-bisphosphoglycerate-dependent phosphoglycerate mutase
MLSTTVYLVRHAHADWQDNESRGLSESGRAAARSLADLLSTKPVAAIYSSPAQRSIETVASLADRLGVHVAIVAELQERQLPVVPEDHFESVVRETWRAFSRGMAGGESNAIAQARGLAAVRRLITRHAGQHLVVATHGNLMALVLNGFNPAFGYEFWRGLSFPDVYQLEFETAALLRATRIWEPVDSDGNTNARLSPRDEG